MAPINRRTSGRPDDPVTPTPPRSTCHANTVVKGSRIAKPARSISVRSVPTQAELDAALRLLLSTGNHQIQKRVPCPPIAVRLRPGFDNICLIVDCETTDLNGEIIEVGVIVIMFRDDGTIGDVVGTFSALRQPTHPITEKATKIHGITNDMVKGKTIDWNHLRALFKSASLVIAHNAAFDRPHFERFVPESRNVSWACSLTEIDWATRGFEGKGLAALAHQNGLFYDGHRALNDCYALLAVLSKKGMGADRTPFAELYEASKVEKVHIKAYNSVFAANKLLKDSGYIWQRPFNGGKGYWHKLIDPEDEAAARDDLSFLAYDGDMDRNTRFVRESAEDRFRDIGFSSSVLRRTM